MLEWLKTVLGDAYTPEIDTAVSQEIGKGFVARTDFNTKTAKVTELETEVKQLREGIKTRDTQLSELKKSAGDNAELQKQLLDLQNKYENDKLILENKQIRLENEKQTYFYLFLFVFILGLGIIAFFLVRKRYRTKLLRNVEIIGNNNAIINRYACRIAELENVSLQERQAKQEEIGILNRKILCLIAENKRVCENSSVDALFVLEELKQGNLIISNMTIAERQHIFDFLDLVHANFITRLKQEFDLTKNELLLAALLKVGFSNKQLMIVFDCEMKSIYKNRQRLKADLGLTKNDSLEQMVMMY